MLARLVAPVLVSLAMMLPAGAQQPVPLISPEGAPQPLGPAQPEIAPQPLGPPPTEAGPQPLGLAPAEPAPLPQAPPEPAPAAADRVFCNQDVTYRLARRSDVAPPYRPFIGVWSDAAWTPSSCAALIVESVRGNGIASILYVYGPETPSPSSAGGVLHGTGVVHNGELRFQNTDGSQFAFHRLFADMQGQLTTPKGQSFQTVFKETP